MNNIKLNLNIRDKLQNVHFDTMSNTKIIFSGIVAIFVVFFSLFIYSYFEYDKLTISTNNKKLNSEFFQIVQKFDDQKVDFNSSSARIDSVFSKLLNTRDTVYPSNKTSRYNPFSL